MLLQNKAEVRNLFQEGGNGEQKRKDWQWIEVTGFARRKTSQYPAHNSIKPLILRLGLDDFKASNGWLERFRNDITADKTGIYYRALRAKKYALRDDKCKGKNSKTIYDSVLCKYGRREKQKSSMFQGYLANMASQI
ncbi:hypothetical protein JTB14_032120 [Gonioctena quinquepunctata]|nr:hypothetical protein JTB14_032120 [Gonioctena quinquepunctata]